MEKIKLVKLNIGEEEMNAVKKVFQTGCLTQGPVTKEFEDEFARYLGIRNAISTSSCTTALDLALLTLDIGPGDEVIVPDFTFPATGNVVFHVGAKPILVDIDLESYNIDCTMIEDAISKKTKAIIPVHLFGQSAEMKKIMEIAEKHGLYVIEDAACGIGSTHYGKKTGTFGDMSCFSFHPRKILTVGEGGMLVTNDDRLADRARLIGNHGSKKESNTLCFVYPGYNFRLSEIASAIGLIQLKKVDALIEKRIELARIYDELLCDAEVDIPHRLPYNKHTYQTYCLLIKKEKKRDELITKLAEKAIETQIGTYALHLQPCYVEHKDIMPLNLTVSEKAFKNTLVLPLYDGLRKEEQDYICSNLVDVLRF